MSEELSPNDARQGRTTGRMRYILGISTGLAVLALVIVFFVI